MDANAVGAPTVYMVDAMWPEFNAWMGARRSAADRLFLPLDGARAGKPQYAWNTSGFAEVASYPWLTAWRAWSAWRVAGQAAKRQRQAIRFRRRLARAYVRKLRVTERDLVITQELLPYVWETGALAQRRFDVLMTSLPMAAVQAQLDAAAACQPESRTLRDFRAEPALLELEACALAAARRVVTPHLAVAALFKQAELLDWSMPAAPAVARGTRLVFPAPTVGRKGAFELRAALRRCPRALSVTGPLVEGARFWDGLDVACVPAQAWMQDVAAVVLPSWLEQRPLPVLLALAAGVPVIASTACGLAPRAGLHLVEPGDVDGLAAALAQVA